MPPAPARPAKDIDRPPFMVKLGLMPPYMAEDVEKAYLARIKDIRPDLGGDPQPFYDVQNAYMQAKEYVKFRGDRRGWIAKRMDEYLAVQEVIERLKSFGAEVETNALDWLEKSFGDFAELTETVLGIRLHNAANGDEFIDYLVSQREQLLELRASRSGRLRSFRRRRPPAQRLPPPAGAESQPHADHLASVAHRRMAARAG